jgi:hypothetical protein
MRVKSLRKFLSCFSISAYERADIINVCIRLVPSDLDYVKECVAAPIIPLEVIRIALFFVQQITRKKIKFLFLDGRIAAYSRYFRTFRLTDAK